VVDQHLIELGSILAATFVSGGAFGIFTYRVPMSQ
jgi:hypothetical protein